LADSVRRAAYLDAVRTLGGGDVSLDVRSVTRAAQRAFLEQVGTEWNPSLWVQKIGPQEATEVPKVPFLGARRDPATRLLNAFRRRRIARSSTPRSLWVTTPSA
jgi:hypothetical protein